MKPGNRVTVVALLAALGGVTACGTDVGGNEDSVSPVVTIDAIVDSDPADSDIIGVAAIQWTSDEPNPSSVDIMLSNDSGVNYDTYIAVNVPDTGEYVWDTDTVPDCRTCRLKIVATDVVGNAGAPAESAADFVINNVPQLSRDVPYFDAGNDGFGVDDKLIMTFDKDIKIRAPVARDFQLPVTSDSFGDNATVDLGPGPDQVTVTLNLAASADDIHLHVQGVYSPGKHHASSPSGVDVIRNMPPGTIYAVDNERTAEPYRAVDIIPAFSRAALLVNDGQAEDVDFADVNGDGFMDFAMPVHQGIKIWLGDGSGGFTDTGQSLSNVTYSIHLVDVDNINGPDIVAGNLHGPNKVWLNNGSGVFTDSLQDLGSGQSYGVAVGDVNGDDHVDVVVGNDGGDANTVWLNNGSGVFADSGQMLGSGDTEAIELCDIDKDGDLDIISGNASTESILIWMNNGSGVYTDSGQLVGSYDTQSVVTGDADGDGDLDILEGTFTGPNHLYLNDGSGVFTDSGQAFVSSRSYKAILGDIDGDNDMDIVEANLGVNRVWLNDGTGQFTDPGIRFGSEYSYDVVMLDIDNDGDNDLFTPIGYSTQYSISPIWLNSMRSTNSPHFVQTGQSLGNGYTWGIDLADVDNDGDIDMFEANVTLNDEGDRLWLNDGQGVFTDSGQAFGQLLYTYKAKFSDVDNDGDPDIVTGHTDGVRVYLNDGAGIYTDTMQLLAAGSRNTIGDIALGDIDGDNDPDLVTGLNYNNDENRIWLNNGDGTFVDSGQIRSSEAVSAVALADVDGDMDLDIIDGEGATYSGVGRPNRVWLNNGSGTFTDSGQTLGSGPTTDIATGDVDGDGDIDIVAGNRTNGAPDATVVWINSGVNTGVFVAGDQLGNNDTRAIALSDIDGDGDLDVIEGNIDNTPDVLYLNDGSGSFTVSGDTLSSGSTYALAVADVDQDGDADMLVGSYDEQSNTVWAGDR